VIAADERDSVEDAMSARSLGQYFRSFLVRLSMIESQLGPLDLGGEHPSFSLPPSSFIP
jgi:mitotic spindle assembly checkpoint protein MAD2B